MSINLPAIPSPTEMVTSYYDEFGWQSTEGVSGEDKTFRVFPSAYAIYEPANARRIEAAFAGFKGTIAFVGCGDMPESHLRIAKQFNQVICCDVSRAALSLCEQKLADQATYVLGSIVDTALQDGIADVVFCPHALYHVDRSLQEQAVRQMLRLTKPGGRVVVMYANPLSPLTIPAGALRWLKQAGRRKGAAKRNSTHELYYYAYPLSWWRRFGNSGGVSIEPGSAIASRPARHLLRTASVANAFYRAAKWLEHRHPRVAAKIWQFPMVIVDKATFSEALTID